MVVLRRGRTMTDRPRLRLVSLDSEAPEVDDDPPLTPFAAAAVEQSAMRALLRGLSMLASSAGNISDAGMRAEEVVAVAVRIPNATRARLWRIDDAGTLTPGAGCLRSGRRRSSVPEVPTRDFQALCRSLRAGRTLAIVDLADDPRTRPLIANKVLSTSSGALLAAPVVRAGALVGVLLVEQSRPSALSSGDDVLVASALAGLYAAALDPVASEPVAEAVAPEVGARRDSWPSPGGRA